MAREKTVIRCEVDVDQLRAARLEVEAFQNACRGAASRLSSFSKALSLLRSSNTAAGESVRAMCASLNGLRDALAGAFAPVMSAVAPLVAALCDMLATAVSYIAMFFAALSGGTYAKLVTGQNNYNKSLKAGGGAAKKLVNNLSSLDELHLWREPTGGGGGGGGSAGGIGDLFEDQELENAEGLRKVMKDILWYAGAVGAALLTWKVARAFGASMRTALGLAVAVGGAVVAVKGQLDAWENGFDFQNLLESLGGIALAVGGVALAAGPIPAALAAVVGAVALAVNALHDWRRAGKLSADASKALAAALGIAGAALSLLSGNLIPLAAGAVGAAAALVIGHWDKIKQAAGSLKDRVSERFAAMAGAVRESVGSARSWVQEHFEAIRAAVAERADAARSAVTGAFTAIGASIAEKLAAARQTVTDIFRAIRDAVRDRMEAAKSFVSGAVDAIKGFLDFDWTLPHIKLPHFTITGGFSLRPLSVPKLGVSWYARGGIVDGASLIGAGEDGKEAIVPLERHTEWISLVARQLAAYLGQRSPEMEGLLQRLDKLSAAIEQLGLAVSSVPMPALAAGTVIPPRAAYAGGAVQGLGGAGGGEDGGQLRQMLAELAGGKSSTYRFTAQVDRRVLFDEMIEEAKLRQMRSGKSPFDF